MWSLPRLRWYIVCLSPPPYCWTGNWLQNGHHRSADFNQEEIPAHRLQAGNADFGRRWDLGGWFLLDLSELEEMLQIIKGHCVPPDVCCCEAPLTVSPLLKYLFALYLINWERNHPWFCAPDLWMAYMALKKPSRFVVVFVVWQCLQTPAENKTYITRSHTGTAKNVRGMSLWASKLREQKGCSSA